LPRSTVTSANSPLSGNPFKSRGRSSTSLGLSNQTVAFDDFGRTTVSTFG
jgi:hypothetical protein